MYEVCDSRKACSIINGPSIMTLPSEITDSEYQTLINIIKSLISRMEYNAALRKAFATAITFKVSWNICFFNQMGFLSSL